MLLLFPNASSCSVTGSDFFSKCTILRMWCNPVDFHGIILVWQRDLRDFMCSSRMCSYHYPIFSCCKIAQYPLIQKPQQRLKMECEYFMFKFGFSDCYSSYRMRTIRLETLFVIQTFKVCFVSQLFTL